MKILIVDGQLHTWDSIIRYFRRHTKYIVYQASTLSQAEAEVEDSKFDLIICNGSLHGIGDGTKFALKLHQSGQKVILCSSDDWSRSIGDMPRLKKPVLINDLEAMIHTLILE